MSILLLIHLCVVLVLTLSSSVLLIAGIKRINAGLIAQMSFSSFGLTILSGIGLIAFTSATLTHFCVTMTIYSVAFFAIRIYYQKRLPARFSALKN